MVLNQKVLVIDDEESMREVLEIVLSGDGYDVTCVSNVDEAREKLEAEAFDVVLTDLRMGSEREAGLELLTWLQEHAPATPAIMLTAHGSIETAIEAMRRGAADYVMKPFKNDELRMLLRRTIEQRNILRENAAFRKEQTRLGKVENMVGTSSSIEAVRTMIRKVATLPSTVAIYGESGVGKELVARAIHALSDRLDKPFVAINCGGIPENLLESELFGHRKGSFTGAHEDKDGLFIVANGGTLFLDEIGDMPFALQVKLLRVLDNQVVMPVGGIVDIPVDVRIISSTNRDLEEMVERKEFRKDLFYRLNVIPVCVPPLQEREDDIPLLARHFVATHAPKLGHGALEISKEAQMALRKYEWPGNVRELQNVMERAVALCDGKRVDISDMPPHIRNYVAEPAESKSTLPPGGLDLEEIIGDIESDLIKQAMERARYSQKKAAQLLGLSSRSLRYRLKKYRFDDK